MKTMKVALLATAALAAVSVSARADDTAAIRAQLEALTARIAQLEAAPAVPVGFSLLTISEGSATVVPGLEPDKRFGNENATIIGILPTADAPASATIEWSGYVRAAIYSTDYEDNTDLGGALFDADTTDTNVSTRAQINLTAKTDTAVGEVGMQMNLRGNVSVLDGDPNVSMQKGWGWWMMTPELTLGGGYAGSLGNIGEGYDGACTHCYMTDAADLGMNPGDSSQLRLSYASGPLAMAIAIEDATGGGFTPTSNGSPWHGGGADDLGVAAEVKYSGDVFGGEISGVYHDGSDLAAVNAPLDDISAGQPVATAGESWQVGAGIHFNVMESTVLSFGAAIGQTQYDADYWAATAVLEAGLTDTIHLELGAGYKSYDYGNVVTVPGGPPGPPVGASGFDRDTWGVMAGIYYEPVDQLTIGLEGEYSETNQDGCFSCAPLPLGIGAGDYEEHFSTIALVTVYRF